eukprot:PLAT5079.1.p1 GENE.PLAT5079.1~~PLAT5079.1.p1  ORF type:complete len:418 (+),score=122.10 PLAT5079.1:152-1255(+)
MVAQLLPASDEGIAAAGQAIRDGRLVAFPTETVYGLGAHALDEAAVRSIFATKERPLTDPLIVHVTSLEQAEKIVRLEGRMKELFYFMADRFWPGPLTMVGPATDAVPGTVTAGTGFVGVRSPSHELARRLIDEAGVPIAAPSANKFGHVSPTSPAHVLADLGGCDIHVLDSGVGEGEACAIGIESTVLGLSDMKEGRLTLFRRGGISERALIDALVDAGFPELELVALSKSVVPDDTSRSAPGQSLTHYAPAGLHSFLVAACDDDEGVTAHETPIEETVVVDFAGQMAPLAALAAAYRDLSAEGDVMQAAKQLFATLRWAETVEGASHCALVDMSAGELGKAEHSAALFDRMFRAASGKRHTLPME